MMNFVPDELIGPRKRPRIICKEEIDEKSKKVLQKGISSLSLDCAKANGPKHRLG